MAAGQDGAIFRPAQGDADGLGLGHANDRAAIQSKLNGMDALFHHLQDDVRGWSRIPRRQIGTLGILTKLEMAEEALHHLMEDVGVSLSQGLEEPPLPETFAPQSQGLSIAPPPPLMDITRHQKSGSGESPTRLPAQAQLLLASISITVLQSTMTTIT